MTNEFLVASGISKNFAGVKALRSVDLTINRGEISCLVGENGSGKSTLIKIMVGVYKPDSGQITIDGTPYHKLQPIDAIHAGIQVIFQDFSLFPNLTVAENIALNYRLAQGKRLVNWRDIHNVASEALARIEVELPLNVRVERMSVADKQLIAISRALLQNAQLIIMDEPTTALTEREVRSLFKVIGSLREKGISILFVSHKLNEVQEIAERVVVLRNGEKVLDTSAADLDEAKIAYYMTGLEFQESVYTFASEGDAKAPLLKVQNLSRPGFFENISFEMQPGEILGITGLLGSGRSELAEALFGVQPARSGNIFIDGKRIHINGIQDAIRHDIGYVPEDRLTEGLFLARSIGNNIVVRTIEDTLNALGLVNRNKEQQEIDTWVDDLRIKTNDAALPVSSLSGGNQQRVVLAKWLADNPRLLILNGPTVGVDIGSKTELHQIIKELARRGMGIIVISDDIPEILHTCNRILLMKRGRIVEEMQAADTTETILSTKLREASTLQPEVNS